MENIFTRLLSLLFPHTCLVCKKEGSLLCAACLGKIPRLQDPLLEREKTYTLFPYKNPSVKSLLWLLKYRNIKDAAMPFADPLSRNIEAVLKENNDIDEEFVIIPIPTTKKGLLGRGFNQTELLAQLVLKNPKRFLVKNLLGKKKGIRKQTECKTKRERQENIRGAFFIKNPEDIRDKNFILIDDIVTTGATAREARKTLFENGAKKVYVFAIAYQTIN